MAKVSYLIRGKSNPTKIYCRYINGRKTVLQTPLDIMVNPKYWDKKNQQIRNVVQVKNRDDINKQLRLLSIHIIDYFNDAYMTGEIIDKDLLIRSINTYFNRPKDENIVKDINHTIFYTDFAEYWIKEQAPTWRVNAKNYLNERDVLRLTTFIDMVKEYQQKSKIKLSDVDSGVINGFVDHLYSQNYASSTIKRHVVRFKFFCNRAIELDINVNPAYKQRVFVPESQEIKKPYLNLKEIESIYKLDLSDNEALDNVRDNLIIACWTGLRISDFLGRLDLDNFIDDFIEITTQKTKTKVTIPLHPMVKDILIKRKGQLPKKISDQKFNKHVKVVCEKAKINNIIPGTLHDKKTKRNVFGTYPKYKLISSHIGRRSFATNHIGKIDDITIMGIAGWSKKEQMYKYIKLSGREHAEKLKQYWETVN